MSRFLPFSRSVRLLGFLLAASCAVAADRPNLVVINIDDLGYAEIGPFGGRNRTPALDRMAAEGRKLTSFYAAPVCSPSRASLLTGCYPKRVLPVSHVLFPNAAVGLHPDEATIADVLKAAGYATACVGKWHLGDQRDFLPLAQGFDSYFGLPYSNDMGPAADGTRSNFGAPPPAAKAKAAPAAEAAKKKTAKQAAPAPAPGPSDDLVGVRGADQPPLALLEGDKVVARIRAEDQLDLTRRYTERAVAFIRERRDRPFFLYLAHSAVHFPLYPSSDYRGKSGNGLLGDWIQEVDASVGAVLGALRAAGLDRNTLVLFVSDNGGPVNQGAVNTPLRGSKGTTWEGGIRVPALAWWPGRIPAASSTDAVAGMLDVLPTFAALAGAPLPAGRKLDGVDQSPILFGAPAAPPRDGYLYWRGLVLEAVRSGPWKLHLASGELYDLRADPGEATNLAARHSDVAKRLRDLAAAGAADLGPTGVGPGCRPLGRVDVPRPLIALDGTVRPDAVGVHSRLP
jgi:arylsulfatase A